MRQPRSGCTRRGFGRAARQLRGAGDPRRDFGGCRAGAWRVCHFRHPRDRRTAAGRARLDAWLAGLARDTGILSPACRTTKRDILNRRALSARCQKIKTEGNQRGCLVPPCTTLGEVRGGSNAARRQVIQIPAGYAPHLPPPPRLRARVVAIPAGQTGGGPHRRPTMPRAAWNARCLTMATGRPSTRFSSSLTRQRPSRQCTRHRAPMIVRQPRSRRSF
jgi:hypothetical protein